MKIRERRGNSNGVKERSRVEIIRVRDGREVEQTATARQIQQKLNMIDNALLY